MSIIPTIEKRLNQRAKAFQMYGINKMGIINECRYWLQICYGKPDNLTKAIIHQQILPRLKSIAPSQKSQQHDHYMRFIIQIESQLTQQ